MAINWLDVHTDVADKPSGESMANYISAIPADAGAVLTQAENVADFGVPTVIGDAVSEGENLYHGAIHDVEDVIHAVDHKYVNSPSRQKATGSIKSTLEHHTLIGGGIAEIGAEGLPELGGEAEQLATHYGLTTLGKGLVGGAAAAVGGEIYEHFKGGSQMAVNAEHGTIIKKWSANGAQFEEYSDGTISVLKKNGRVKNYRPYHPKVFGKKLKINAFLSLAKKYEKDYKGLKKIFEKRARRK